ncbi:MAG: GTP-binding protein [Candidatus Lokiarchaeota archaeon]|nr:GTP-binding protein [Candidatus Lokiarchaeota archaeon]
MENQKICIIGEGGVGKSSLISLLQGIPIKNSRTPTIGLEIEDSILNGKKCSIWDLGGQERFRFMWKDFLRQSGLTVLVCDSTQENLEKTKDILKRFSKHLDSKIIAIANKQDLDNALSPDTVEKKLGIKTYGMSAIRMDLRKRMCEILEYEIKDDLTTII